MEPRIRYDDVAWEKGGSVAEACLDRCMHAPELSSEIGIFLLKHHQASDAVKISTVGSCRVQHCPVDKFRKHPRRCHTVSNSWLQRLIGNLKRLHNLLFGNQMAKTWIYHHLHVAPTLVKPYFVADTQVLSLHRSHVYPNELFCTSKSA
jgi:hypothetical protein